MPRFVTFDRTTIKHKFSFFSYEDATTIATFRVPIFFGTLSSVVSYQGSLK